MWKRILKMFGIDSSSQQGEEPRNKPKQASAVAAGVSAQAQSREYKGKEGEALLDKLLEAASSTVGLTRITVQDQQAVFSLEQELDSLRDQLDKLFPAIDIRRIDSIARLRL